MRLGLSLRPQLAMVSLLLLLLPWAGCQSIREIESVLRQGQADTLKASMQAVTATLQQQPQLFTPISPYGTPLVAKASTQPMIIDGYDDEWHQDEFAWREFKGIHHGKEVKLLVKMVTDLQQIYLFFRVFQPKVHYYKPQQPDHSYDRIWLYGLDQNQTFNRWQIKTELPGAFTLEKTEDSGKITSIEGKAFFRQRSWGYQIELTMPLNWVCNGIGFRLFSVASSHDQSPLLLTTGPSAHSAPVPLILPKPKLDQLLANYAPPGVTLSLLNKQGWQLAAGKGLGSHHSNKDKSGYWLIEKIYNLILAREDLPLWSNPITAGQWQNLPAISDLPKQQWYRDKLLNRQLQLNAILLKDHSPYILTGSQGSERLLSQAGHAFDRLFLVSLLIMLVAGLGLLAYASLLSVRIRRLSRQADDSVTADGKTLKPFTASTAKDEIGELSRIIAQLLERQSQYSQYLQTLASKLSHELRTPLAIVRTSLDNLNQEPQTPTTEQYIKRAISGGERLSQILSSLSMASRLEQMIEQSDMEYLDLAGLLTELIPAYQEIYTEQQFKLKISSGNDYHSQCYPELLVQLLDKLVDNAADFTPKGQVISINLHFESDIIKISVFNQGSQLPQAMTDKLFDSLVSLREKQYEKPHLGLGLYIAKLIAQQHEGKIEARNAEGGVEFCLSLPVVKKEHRP